MTETFLMPKFLNYSWIKVKKLWLFIIFFFKEVPVGKTLIVFYVKNIYFQNQIIILISILMDQLFVVLFQGFDPDYPEENPGKNS